MIKKTRKLFLQYISILAKTTFLFRMPFLYHLLEIKPRSAVIMLTNRCNLKCVMCKLWDEVPEKELSTEDWMKIIEDLKRNGIKNIHFTGGEPLLRRDLCELIQYSSQRGFVVGITTNGILLKKEMLDKLINAGLRSIAISVDALNGKYEELRGVANSFKKIEDTLSLVSDAKERSRIDVCINFVLMKSTIDEFKNVKNLVDRLHLPIFVALLDRNPSIFKVRENKALFWISNESDFQKLSALTNFLREEKIKKPSSLISNFVAFDFITAYFKEPIQEEIPCISSQDRVFIDPCGNLSGGCLSMGSFGNVRNNSFGDLLKEERYKRAKKNMFYKKCPGCSCGYFFNIRHFPPVIIKDFLIRLKYIINKNVRRKISCNYSN